MQRRRPGCEQGTPWGAAAVLAACTVACSNASTRPGPLDDAGIDVVLADVPWPDTTMYPLGPLDGATVDSGNSLDAGDGGQDAGGIPGVSLGPGMDLATADQRSLQGFVTGYPDGQLGALMNNDRWTFYGAARSNGACAGAPGVQGVYRLGGTPDGLTTAYGCNAVLTTRSGGPPLVTDSPYGYFDRDYVGGGPVLRITSPDGGRHGVLLLFRTEFHWGAVCGTYPCFDSALGLAVSVDDGTSFQSMGQVVQAYPVRAEVIAAGGSLDVGSGTLVLGDSNGAPVPQPQSASPTNTWIYVLYTDRDPTEGCPGACLAVARARLSDVATAAFSATPVAAPGLFRKYWRGAFSTAAVSGDANEGVHAGHASPILTDPVRNPSVLYDRTLGRFLMAHEASPDIVLRVGGDLLHWSGPLAAATVHEPGNVARFPSLLGETGDPAQGAATPWLFYNSGLAGGTWHDTVFRRHTVLVAP